MSYRALKHLLGETSLERKCRFLLGAGILVLISGSFWWYALQTEALAYDQTLTTGRLLVNPIVDKYHLKDDKNIRDALEKFQLENETHWPEWLSKYEQRILLPRTREARNEPQDRFERQLLIDFAENDQIFENSRQLPSDHVVVYYGAVRAMPSCLGCHNVINRERAKKQSIDIPELRENGLIAVVKVKMRTEAIENSIHLNRAILISTALVTALLIMAGSYLIIRYVIVKPVKHLKEVSDAISAGELNVRSEIQTGDEFEDLSHAFNRMLRNLVNMQDRLRKVNTDLDRKVDELARVNLALYESNRIKTDFLATMSHELRTPLNSILGFSEVLLSASR